MEELAAALAAMALLEKLIPIIEKRVESGTLSKDQQAEIRNRYNELVNNLDAKFTGPEWEQG